MEERPMIYSALIAAMSCINAVGKNQKNEQQGWKFRGIDDVYNALQPALIAAGICVATNVLEEQREVTPKNANRCILKVQFTLYAADGSNINVTTYGEAVDYGDKSYSKAMSMAYKYFAFQTFVIPTEEMRENDPDRFVPDEIPANKSSETHVKPLNQSTVTKSTSVAEQAQKVLEKQSTASKTKQRNGMIARAAQAAGTDLNGIMAAWKELQLTGVIPSKSSSSLSDEQFATALAAVADHLNGKKQ